MVAQHLIGLSGLVAAALFILGLKRMSSPATALSGIVFAGAGMMIAVAASLVERPKGRDDRDAADGCAL